MLRYLLTATTIVAMLCQPASAQRVSDLPKLQKQQSPYIGRPAPRLPAWSYDGEQDNQDRWGDLSEAYAQCLLSLEQSPVRISYTEIMKLPALKMDYRESDAIPRFHNNALEIDLKDGGTLTIGDKSYRLMRIAFHSPGEHIVREEFHIAEAQLVHMSSDGDLLMVSVFIDAGAFGSKSFDTILQNLPTKTPSGEAPAVIRIDASSLLPEKRGYYSYKGSLTIPPCTENVQWRVMKSPIAISDLQMQSLARYLGRNARSAQPIYGRTIYESEE